MDGKGKLGAYFRSVSLPVAALPTQDQYVVSLVCRAARYVLDVVTDPSLQIDVLNAARHLGVTELPTRAGLLDPAAESVASFHVFHYNEQKPDYLERVREGRGDTT